MILHRYFARRFAQTFLRVVAAFAAIIVLTSLIEEIGSTSGVGIAALLWLSVLAAPETLYQILPLVVILAGVAHFLGLARSSELVVTRAAGRSASRAVFGPALVVVVISAVSVSVGNPIVAATAQKYETQRAALKSETRQVANAGDNGLWLREGDTDGHRIIRAQTSNADGTQLRGASFNEFGAGGVLKARIEADLAELTNGVWRLKNAVYWPLDDPAPQAGVQRHARLDLPSTLTQQSIRDSFGDPSDLPIWDLPEYIQKLERAGFSARRYLVYLHAELAQPLFLLAMMVLAAGFTMGPQRGGGTGRQVLGAVLSGFALYFVRNFVMVLGESGQLPAILSAWAPSLAALMLAVGLLLQREDG